MLQKGLSRLSVEQTLVRDARGAHDCIVSPTVKPRDQLPSLFTPEFYRNPYPAYATLRRSDPVHWDEEHQVWLLTRYADVAAALAEPRLARGAGDLKVEAEDPLRRVLSRMMLFSEPPRHTRLRALANRAFTPRRVEAMRQRIQAIVDELLDAIDGRHELDVIANLAYPLPVMVISEILSLPSADLEQFKRWSDDVIAYSAGATEAEGRARESVRALLDYFRELAAHLRRSPDGSIMSALVEAETEGSRLDEEELLANAILLLMNGHETTTDTIANGVLALLQHSDQLDKLRARPSLVTSAVEELMRYDGAVQLRGVRSTRDLQIGGTLIGSGQTVFMVIGAANRDPAQFPEPDRLDIERVPNRHLELGHGIHFCLGAALARAESQIAINSLLARRSYLELASEHLEWKSIPVFRGLLSLPVRTWEPASEQGTGWDPSGSKQGER